MKKHILAAAVAVAVSAPAMAQNVTISGRDSLEVGQWKATGATAGAAQDFENRTRVADTASRFTFAATEDLGGGLRAGVYCETGINIDNAAATGQANTANPNTSEFCSREGRVSIGNNMVEVRLGRQNVWWTQGALNGVGSTFLGTDTGTNMFNMGVGVAGVRLPNMVMIHANSGFGAFAGSNVYAGVLGASGEAVGIATSPRGKYDGFKIQWAQGEFVAMADVQRSEDPAGAAIVAAPALNVSGLNVRDRQAVKLGFGYRFMGASSPSIVSIQTWDKSMTSTTAQKFQDDGWLLVGLYDLGGGLMLHGQYSKASGVKTTANSGATATTIGLTKALSKRTHLYGAMHSITNNSAGLYAMTGGNYQSGEFTANTAGADTRAWGLGMIHNF